MADLACYLHSLRLLLTTLRPEAAISDDLDLLSSPFLSGANRRICTYRMLNLGLHSGQLTMHLPSREPEACAIVAAFAVGRVLLRQFVP